jgi:hypothetical protein
MTAPVLMRGVSWNAGRKAIVRGFDINVTTSYPDWIDRHLLPRVRANGRAEVERLIRLGAVQASWRYPPTADDVLEDPDGNRFCVVQRDRARDEIRDHELGYYLETLEQVRAKTLAELGRRDDRWLEEQTSFGSGLRVNNYFKWFHVIGHEINHRGQIRWLRSRATKGQRS